MKRKETVRKPGVHDSTSALRESDAESEHIPQEEGTTNSHPERHYLYHVTKTENVPRILEAGLQPTVGEISSQAHAARPAVYFWFDRNDALWAKTAYEKATGKPHTILRVDQEKLVEWTKEATGVDDLNERDDIGEIVSQFYPARISDESEGLLTEFRLYKGGVKPTIIEIDTP
jgi:hypothetical protein